MSFRAPLQCVLPLTFLLLGLGPSSASAAETQALRPFELAQAPDQTPPSANKEKPDEPAKKHPQQDKAKPDAQKQQQLQQDKAKADAQKQQQLQQDKAKADAQKQQQLQQDRAKADAQKQQQLQQDKAKADAEKQQQLQQDRAKADAQKQQQLQQDKARADAQKQQQLQQDKAKADAEKQQQLQQDKAKADAEKQQQLQQDKAEADAEKQQQLHQDKAKADAQKHQEPEQDRTKADAQKQQQLLQDKAKAGAQQQEPEQDKAKAEADQQKQLEQEKAKTKIEALKSRQPDQAQQPVTENNPKAVEQVRQDRAKADDAFAKAKEEARQEREQAKTAGKPEDKAHEQRREADEKKFEDLRQQRQERVEDGGRRIVIEEPDKRRIIREEGKTIIRHDETERFRRSYGEVRTERRGDVNVTVVVRPGGAQIFTDLDDDGHALRRYRRDPDGREYVFFDNRDYYRRARRHTFLDAIVDLAPPVISIPRERYIVDYERASDDDIYDALSAEPVERLDRAYSLEEVRYSPYLRDRMPRVDLDSLTFDFGSWEVDPYQYEKLERVAHVMNRVLERHPEEMFLIEGHTDAVGSDEDNLSLSDRRAESVAEILTKEFGIPAENLTTQGYGEQFLKVDTPGPERLNRRVAIRRITPLISRSERYGDVE